MSFSALFGACLSTCGGRPRCDGVACAAACPRSAARDVSGRCACVRGDLLVLGACVPPAIADAYCGPAARFGLDGCAFRECSEDSVLDAATGACIPRTQVPSAGAIACGGAKAPIVAQGRTACVDADAVCPRGTRRAGPVCARPPSCPPGTLVAGDACRAVVTVGARDDFARVDLGAWATFVLGADGGPGTPDLCRPLSLRTDAFSLPQDTPGSVSLRIAVVAPDQDLTRVHARIGGALHTAATERSLSTEAERLVAGSVMTLIEPLRGLGGEASTGVVEVRVTCGVGGL
jgi:hypothetical protein